MLALLALLQEAAPNAALVAKNTNALLGAGIGLGLAVVGCGIGLGLIGGNIASAIARQPEAAKEISNGPFIIVFLLEGVTIIALVFALMFKLMD